MKKLTVTFVLTIASTQLFAQSVFDRMNEWVTSGLAGSTGLGSYLLLFVGGILASLLPCVYPIYPLTVNFLRNRNTGLPTFLHPLVYYAGLVFIYLLFGVIASMTGGTFNEILRLPIANLSIGIMFFLMALATVDYIHIPFFGGQVDSKNNGLAGTFIMGAGAGLLSSACVGPIVVSILLAIVTNAEQLSFGLATVAALKMTFFGLGVGIPILLLGVFGLALPKSGKWMHTIQWIFAGIIGYFAYGYFVKALNLLGIGDLAGLYLLVGSALVFLAFFNLQPIDKPKSLKTRTALYALGGVVGFFIIGANTLTNPETRGTVGTTVPNLVPNTEQKGNLTWYLNKEAAYQAAAETGKLVFVDFHGDWCTNCKAFQKQAIDDEELNRALQNAILYKVYDTSVEFENYRSDARFPELKIGLPFFLITDANTGLIYKTNDFTKTEEMILFLE